LRDVYQKMAIIKWDLKPWPIQPEKIIGVEIMSIRKRRIAFKLNSN